MRLSLHLASAVLFMSALFGVGPAVAKFDAQTGVLVTPRNFPNHTAPDIEDMFRLGAELGSFAVIRVDWNDPRHVENARVLVSLAEQRGLATALELSPFKADGLTGAKLQAPKEVESAAGGSLSFSNPAVSDAFSRTILELAALKPSYLAIATDVNLFAQSNPDQIAAFAGIYQSLAKRIGRISPKTTVFVTFQWEAMQGKSTAVNRRLVEQFRSGDGLTAFTSDPIKLFEKSGPSGIPGDYYARMADYRSGNSPVLVEVNWPSEGSSGEADQATFIRSLPARMDSLNPTLLAWTFLHDVKIFIFTVKAGLLDAEGKQKPGFAAFRALGGTRAPAIASAAPIVPAASSRARIETASRAPAHFGIYTARLDGSEVTTLMTSPDQEMTHPRVSPDGRRIVLTRYNERDKSGKATEDKGYANTEIMLLNLDGSGLETIIAPKPGIIAANGDWTPDGKSLIFISTDNPKRSPEIRIIDLASREITRLPTPDGLQTTDPHWEGDKVVFPVKGGDADALWIMNKDGSKPRQITRPENKSGRRGSFFGDFDPKISPDGSKVAFMRIYGGDKWRVMVLDLKTDQERELTPKGDVIEGLPTWSSDGRLLLFRHIDRSKPREIGLYTMTPDGSSRKIVPLPRGYLYNHGTFFPGDGSSPKARIIYTGTVNLGL